MTQTPPRESIRYRSITPEDTEFLRRLYCSTRDYEMVNVPWTDEQKAQFLTWQFLAQKQHYEDAYPDCAFLMIEMDGIAIGRLYLDRGPRDIEIVDIALLPEYRGRGIGAMLLREILDEGRASGKRVRIYVEHYNPARHLYDRLQFRHIDTNGVYHLMEWVPPCHPAEA